MISIPLTLLVVLGALFLLAKAQKDALHDAYKFAAYFILVVCVFNFAIIAVKACCKNHKKEKHAMMFNDNMQCKMNMKSCHHMMMGGDCSGKSEGCGEERECGMDKECEMEKGCHVDGKDMKVIIKKDSIKK